MAEQQDSTKSAPKDNVGDLHDDGLWPDYEMSTQSVRTEEAGGTDDSTHDTVVKEPEAKEPEAKSEKQPAKK